MSFPRRKELFPSESLSPPTPPKPELFLSKRKPLKTKTSSFKEKKIFEDFK